jgi:hypothetical protein
MDLLHMADERTDMTKLISLFKSFIAKVPKNHKTKSHRKVKKR